jgi:eukaryotic-like serine/threonine-protein kinase
LIDFEAEMERFEEAWQTSLAPRIADFIPRDASSQSELNDLVVELVKIDMEYRWRRAPSALSDSSGGGSLEGSDIPWRPTLDDYRDQIFSGVDFSSPPLDLVVEEYRIRRRWGDEPTFGDFQKRYPDQHEELSRQLQIVEQELSSRRSFLQRPKQLSAPKTDSRISIDDICLGDQLGDFQILRELGQGAFAKVFLAQQISMQRFVALKVSDQHSKESTVLAQLDHPNIVRVYDERTSNGLQLVYMQYVAGGNLRGVVNQMFSTSQARLTEQNYLGWIWQQSSYGSDLSEKPTAKNRPMDWPLLVAWIGAKLAEALAHAHEKGILHRDIKPENILLSADGRPLIADFNLSFSQQLAESLDANKFGGTLEFMSPEQLQVLFGIKEPKDVGPASDLYSLSLVLFLLLTGKPAFPVPDFSHSGAKLLSDQLANRQTIPRTETWISESKLIGNLIVGGLAYAPQDRPQSASWLRRQFELCRFTDLRALLSPPTGAWLGRVSRYPAAAALAAGLLSSLMLSPLNMWANRTIAIKGFDRDFFHRVEEPVVNLILFPAGVLLAWISLQPIRHAIRMQQQGSLQEPPRRRAAMRCLQFPWMMFILVLSFWSGSGIIFPVWNRIATGSQISVMDVLGFFVSQLLHGLVAACLALVLICMVIFKTVYPRLMSRDESLEERRWLAFTNRCLSQGNSLLQVTPLFALLAIAVSEQLNKSIFITLAFVGFVSHVVTSSAVPKIKEWMAWYDFALGPTEELSQRIEH